MKHPFSTEELLIIFEAALLGMGNSFDWLSDKLDLSDDEMVALYQKLNTFMDTE